ncbi:MAG: manganese efflux pump MntP family protein [Eggerthella sp.]|nr:manganese efflux pump MntP family protein [Eggerthella sp.]
MSIVEIVILGLALSMDAFAVTISNSFAYPNISRARSFSMPLAFGFFQFLMPVVGFVLGQLVSDFITQYAGIITFVILGFIGGKMIWDAFHEEEGEEASEQALTMPVLLFQAVATSIDALAVGVSFAALEVNVLTSSGIIGVTTALTCIVALVIGKRFGNALGEKATIIGGAVLILIGLKSLLL